MNINPMTFPAYFNNPLLRMTLCAHMGNLCIHGLKKKRSWHFHFCTRWKSHWERRSCLLAIGKSARWARSLHEAAWCSGSSGTSSSKFIHRRWEWNECKDSRSAYTIIFWGISVQPTWVSSPCAWLSPLSTAPSAAALALGMVVTSLLPAWGGLSQHPSLSASVFKWQTSRRWLFSLESVVHSLILAFRSLWEEIEKILHASEALG